MAPSSSSSKKPVSLKGLQVKLKETQSQLANIWAFIEDYEEGTSVNQIQVRLDKLDDLIERFGDNLVEIRSHDDFVEEGDSYSKERKEFSNRYYEMKAFLLDKLKALQEPSTLNQSLHAHETTFQGSLDNVRLPQIKLQMFTGEIEEWLSFRDLYVSLIHSKVDLPEVEKFHYLKGCLQGEPRNLIDPLKITRVNYQVAWDMLLKKYNDSKLLKKRQIQSLFKLPYLARESISELHNLVEGFERIIQTLDQIVQPVDYKDLLLVNILTTRLDASTRRGWEEFSASKERDTLDDLTEFLQRRMRVLESLPHRSNDNRLVPPIVTKHKLPAVKTSFSTAQEHGCKCQACSEDHYLYTCPKFQNLSIADRDILVRKLSLCRNCFKFGHHARECKSKFSCKVCRGRHHTLVCFKTDNINTSKDKGSSPFTAEADLPTTSHGAQASVSNTAPSDLLFAATAQQRSSHVLLATALVLLDDGYGNEIPARALLDSGSECNFVSERLCQLLRVTREKTEITVQGIGQSAIRVRHKIQATIRSRITGFTQCMNFLVLPKVTVNLPTTSVDITRWSFPTKISLADPTFYISNGIDIVLGIESFFDYFNASRRMPLGEGLPVLVDSVFGWVVCGGPSVRTPAVKINCHLQVSSSLDDLVARFWTCEDVGNDKNNFSPEEIRTEQHFVRTVKRSPSGRYIVSLPKNEDKLPQLGESRKIAIRRFMATERRLSTNESLRNQYTQFMKEYLELGHMQRVSDSTVDRTKRCYLPHHPVIKTSSTTTKLRVVFDGSCKTSTGISLNDSLLMGPLVQEDLRSIIMRSRTRQIMIVSDIEKMFRQINIAPEDKSLQSIVWRFSPSEEIQTFEMNTVTYGTKPAPFLATRVLRQLATDERDRFPLAARTIHEDVYMDDIITGTESIEEAKILQVQLDEIMNSGGFHLRKWASNSPDVLEEIPAQNLAIPEQNEICLDPDPGVTTLGLVWKPKTDVFKLRFNIPTLAPTDIVNKRKILSIIAALYDPLGLIGATITTAKIFLQLLWTLQDADGNKLNWDQPLPSRLVEEWMKYYLKLPLLTEIQIERCVIIPGALSIELHCFSDASVKAYGTCIYVRSQNTQGKSFVRLLTSKSKVSPLKCQSIPRLELCGALLATLLHQKAKQSMRIPIRSYFWTDSTCVLQWLQSIPTTWTTFVANRVCKIQELSEGCEWRHVPGIQNPADLISRGISPESIINSSFWWNGPVWLAEDSSQWPHHDKYTAEEAEMERRLISTSTTVSQTQEFSDSYIPKFSTYTELIRCTAYWIRLINLLKAPKDERRSMGFLTTAELSKAEERIIYIVQRENFVDEIKALTKKVSIPVKSPLRWFNVYICYQDHLLRVGGRLGHSDEHDSMKHPIILPARHLFTKKLLQYYHVKMLHAGPQLLLASVRLRFWPLGGRSVARQIVHQCVRCNRVKPTGLHQMMGDLPSSRVTISRPFSKTGVDYFGPIYIKAGPRRIPVKAYVSIFVCMCTKAVHMELVTDLSTENFIQALRRFVARRGRCSDLFSDNGTNFVGARNQLQALLHLLKNKDHHYMVSRECAKEGIQWHFNPPGAPHFGGLWEAAVKSAKQHMLKVIGDTPLSYEDMNTLLTQVEGCLNSRPLTQMSDDPNDLEPLTPAHFLIGASLQSLPEKDLTEIQLNRLSRWQFVQRKFQEFWRRWRREYLIQLQARTKRWRPAVKIECGKLVIIRDENLPPIRWKMGRIHELHPGDDGVVRVVTLKTASGFLKRPVERICFLPLPESSEQNDHAQQ